MRKKAKVKTTVQSKYHNDLDYGSLKSSIKVNHTEARGNILLSLAVQPSLIFEF